MLGQLSLLGFCMDLIGLLVQLGWSMRGRSGFAFWGFPVAFFLYFGVRNWNFSRLFGFADFGSFFGGLFVGNRYWIWSLLYGGTLT